MSLHVRTLHLQAHKLVQQTLLANLDQVVIVLATAQPEPHFGFLDRYLTICESAQLTPLVCINKVDLEHDFHVEEEAALYRGLGYRLIFTSTQTSEGIGQLRTLLEEHTSLFTGSLRCWQIVVGQCPRTWYSPADRYGSALLARVGIPRQAHSCILYRAVVGWPISLVSVPWRHGIFPWRIWHGAS